MVGGEGDQRVTKPKGVLTMEVRVAEYILDQRGTRIRLDLGNSCFLSFVINSRVEVPKYIKFTAELEPKA